MGAFDVPGESAAFDALREAHAKMGEQLTAPEVNLVSLAKAYQSLANAMAGMANASGRGSLRFEAVVRALDLRTPKSSLRAFMEG